MPEIIQNIIHALDLSVKGVIFILNLILYVFLMGRIIPKFFLKVSNAENLVGDRGLRRYVFKGGRGIVYATIPSYHKYVDKYILYEKDGGKYVKCNVKKGVFALKYEIYTFDADSKLIDSITVDEKLISPCQTSNVKVNENTAYVRLVIRKLNNYQYDTEKTTKIKRSKIILFVITSLIVTVFESFVIRYAVYEVIKRLGSRVNLLANLRFSDLAVVICGLIVALIYTTITLSYYKKKGVKLK